MSSKVAGTWKLPQGELTLAQQFQMLTGTLKNGALAEPLSDAKMNGSQITFKVGAVRYTGRVNGGNSMDGTMSGAANGTWTATRAGT